MKKSLLIILILLISFGLFSSSIDFRGNQSADYIRNFCRLGSLYGLDLINYSPATVALFEDGFYFSLSNQVLFKDYYMYFDGNKYGSDKPTYLLPSLYAAYKKGKIAFFASITVPLGGGALHYDDSLPMAQPTAMHNLGAVYKYGQYGVTGMKSEGFLHADSYSIAFTGGVAYKLSEKFSASIAFRYITAWRNYEGENKFYLKGGALDGTFVTGVEMDGDEDANGIGAIVGLNYKVNDRLNLALKYETKTNLTYKMEIRDGKDFDGLYADGQEMRRDLPALLAVGFNYFILPEKLSFATNFTLYFIESATGNSYDNYNNGYDLAFGFEYYAMNKKLILSASYLRSSVGAKENSFTELEYSLDNNNFAVGCRYYLNPKTALILGFTNSTYNDGYNFDRTIDFHKKVTTFAAGIEIKL